MDEQIHKLLKDILNGISNIELFCSSRPKEYQAFCEDKCFRSAVQWEIAIIGEAMNRILKINPNIPITSARRIVDTRKYLIHGYDSLRNCLNLLRINFYMDSFMDFKNLFGCFRQVSAVVTERFLLSQLAKTAQKSSQNPLKINLNSFLEKI